MNSKRIKVTAGLPQSMCQFTSRLGSRSVRGLGTTSLRVQEQLDENHWDPAIRFVVIVLGTACLYWAQPVLIPEALAILLTFILSPLGIGLQQMGLRRTPAVLVVTFGAATLVILLATVMGRQFLQLAEELPKYEGKITRQIAGIRKQSEHSSLAKLAGLLPPSPR